MASEKTISNVPSEPGWYWFYMHEWKVLLVDMSESGLVAHTNKGKIEVVEIVPSRWGHRCDPPTHEPVVGCLRAKPKT